MLLLLQKILDKPGSAARPDGKISPKNFWVPYILYHNKWSKSIKKFFAAAAFLLDKVPLRGYNKADGNDRPDRRLRCTK
jgi:hypothetical protein